MRTSQLIHCALLLLVLNSAGCNLLGFVASGVAGDPKTPAAFIMAKRPTIVIAEKFDNPAEAALDAEPIARYIGDELTEHQVVPIISPDKVSTLEEANPTTFHGMTIAAIGRAVGAEQIIYVNIISSGLYFADNGDMIRGHGEMRVRVIDSASGATIWPTDNAGGYPVAAETRIFNRAERNDATVRNDVNRSLASRTARLFYQSKNQ
jgi:hypothetical protein